MEQQSKRVLHARYNGVEVARYHRKWFLEPVPINSYDGYSFDPVAKTRVPPPVPLKEKKQVTLVQAAAAAAEGVKRAWTPQTRVFGAGYQIFWRRGSKKFDALVKEACPLLYIDIRKANLGKGHTFWAMKCPGCGEWLRINEHQRVGNWCTDHCRTHGGCGFHGYTLGSRAGYIIDLGDKSVPKKESK